MIIDSAMIAAAHAVSPELNSTVVRKMLEAALAGRVVVVEDEKKATIKGYNLLNMIEFSITSKESALYLAGDLIRAVSEQHSGEKLAIPFVFNVVGAASIVRDDFVDKYDYHYSK